jgi:hypothetical protein
VTVATVIPCPVCGHPGGLMALSGPCLACVRARHRAAMSGRCACPGRQRQPRLVTTTRSAWVTCDRCLGTIRRLP